MFNAIRRSWPGWTGEYGLAGVADALCKLHGPRGPGSAATYNTTTGSWGISDITMRLIGGAPDSTDVGRIWNEGLAFYGWLFYLSKFYELFDTAIVIVKGKKSSLLQTYHHAGAMLAMWAGIRYMSPPIWMFTFINSGLHTLMVILFDSALCDYTNVKQYTYYTLSALMIEVPPALKRTLTSLQITQIVFGASYALAHLFVAYDVPHYTSYQVAHNLSTALPSVASAVSTAISTTAATADIVSWLKKAALRAAGEEGLAENVRNYQGETFGIDAIHAADVQKAQEEIHYKLEMTRTHCLDTSGEVFAILLNVMYLAPLGYMFIRFFLNYFQARAHGDPKPSIPENAIKSANDGIKEVERKIAEAMEDEQGGKTEPPDELKAELEDAKDHARKVASNAQQKSRAVGEKVQDDLKDMRAKAKQGAKDAQEKFKDSAPEVSAKAQQRAEEFGSKAKDLAQNANDYAKDKAQVIKDIAKQKKGEAKDQGSKAANSGAKISKKGSNNADGNQNAGAGNGESGKGQKDDEGVKTENDVDNGEEEGDAANSEREVEDAKKEGNQAKNEKDSNNFKKEDDPADASGYEVNPDLPKTKEEKKAEKEMQPNGT